MKRSNEKENKTTKKGKKKQNKRVCEGREKKKEAMRMWEFLFLNKTSSNQ
jgi:hypothetical protein